MHFDNAMRAAPVIKLKPSRMNMTNNKLYTFFLSRSFTNSYKLHPMIMICILTSIMCDKLLSPFRYVSHIHFINASTYSLTSMPSSC